MAQRFTTRPEIRGTFGVVASTHWLASAVGMSILEKGGNAFDAAAAAGFTLQVVEPHLNGPGGEVPILLWDERWSTQAVERAMIDADVSRARRAEKVDALAAAHILQGAIDALANLPAPE